MDLQLLFTALKSLGGGKSNNVMISMIPMFTIIAVIASITGITIILLFIVLLSSITLIK